MARQLLLKSLVSIFGDFVDGLTEENLKVGVRAVLACGRGFGLGVGRVAHSIHFNRAQGFCIPIRFHCRRGSPG